MHLIEVAFKGNRKEFFHWAGEDPPPRQAAVIVDADRGEDLGTVHAVGDAAAHRFAGVAHGEKAGPVTRQARRLATDEEHARSHDLVEADLDARTRAAERVRAHGLVMKVTDAEWQWDRRKLTLYFTAEKRVDFRALVRDLASTFRTRIELKQIGVRDEARRLDGIGRCGRQYCSASWLPELRPVNLAVAKDQHLSLNPLQISGACGRLMCCLRYEHEFYVQSRRRFPKEGRIVVTAHGEEKVIANDIFNDRVTLRDAEGEVRVVALTELKREVPAGGGVQPAGGAATAAEPVESGTTPVRRERTLTIHQPDRPVRSTRPDPSAGRRARLERPSRQHPDRERPDRERPDRERPDRERPDRERLDREGSNRVPPGQAEPVVAEEPPEVLAPDAAPTDASSDALPDEGGAQPERRRRRRGRRGGRRTRGSARDPQEGESGGGDGSPGPPGG